MKSLRDQLSALISPELIDTLNKFVPHKAPDPRDSEREIWMKAGERRLVDNLEGILEDNIEINLNQEL